MRSASPRQDQTAFRPDSPLSSDEMQALQQACVPVGSLRFPPVGIIRRLRLSGYVEIVLGGIQITPAGLERLLRERKRGRSAEFDAFAALQ